jgi:hypothetical protein
MTCGTGQAASMMWSQSDSLASGPGGRVRDWGDQIELMAPPSTGIIAPVM